jgi:hypothetical protein
MSDIFLSYARENEAQVRPIVMELEKQGWSVFWDRILMHENIFSDTTMP